jgi:hypothetical protein
LIIPPIIPVASMINNPDAYLFQSAMMSSIHLVLWLQCLLFAQIRIFGCKCKGNSIFNQGCHDAPSAGIAEVAQNPVNSQYAYISARSIPAILNSIQIGVSMVFQSTVNWLWVYVLPGSTPRSSNE